MLESEKKGIEVKIFPDQRKMNDILYKFGLKKNFKTEMLIQFPASRKDQARELIWNLKRIHHWWNCSGPNNT